MNAVSNESVRARTRQGAAAAATITVVGGMLVIGGQPVNAANYVVDSAEDDGSGGLTLREAVELANATVGVPDTITFDPGLAGSTITLTNGRVGISDDLTITGLGQTALTLTTTAGDILYLYNGAALSMSDITLTGALDDGISADSSGDLTLSSVTVTASSQDGVRFNSPGADLTITDSDFNGNLDDGIYVGNANNVTLTDTTSSNTGDAGLYSGASLTGSVVLTRTTLSGNENAGLYLFGVASEVTITDSFIDGNDWGISLDYLGGDFLLSGTSVSNNDTYGLYLQGGDGDFTFSGSTIDGNTYDGVQFNEPVVGSVIITGSTIDGNMGDGIELDVIGADLRITDSSLSNNDGDGLKVYSTGGIGGDVTVSGSTFESNGDSGLYVDNVAGDVMVSDTSATDNGNNGLYIEDTAGNVTIMTSVLSRNGDTGAEIESVDGNVTVTDTVFEANEDSGLYTNDNIGGDVVIERVTAIDNEDQGMYVHDVQGSVTISDSTSAGSGDNGIDLDDNVGVVTIERTTVSGSGDNAIESSDTAAELRVVNSTLTANGDAVTDPVIDTNGAAAVVIAHSTISGNGVAGMTAPVIDVYDAAVSVDHSVVSDNDGAAVFAASGTGSVVVTNSLTPVGSALGATNVESNAPLLGSLGDNGGLTETLRPLAGSPVIDAGDPAIVGAPATDQRGGLRVVGTIDIGAVELSAGSVSVADVTVAEDAGFAAVVVTRVDGGDGAATVQVTTADGTALDGVDYTAVDETVSWADGEAGDKTVMVPVIDNTSVEGSRSFAVGLSSPSVVSIADGAATVTITDNDVVAITSLDPSRFVDTRAVGATFDDLFEAEGKRAAGSEYRVMIADRGGVPANATAVVINVTAVAPEATGFVTVHPCVTPLPNVSALNYTAGVNIANEIVAPLSDTGEVCIFTSGAAHIIVEVVGFVDANSPTTPVTPARYLDTRAAGATFDGDDQRGGRTTAGGQVTLKVTDRGDVPADAVAVIANVTAVNPDGKGFVTVHPCEPTPPNASSLNYVDGVNRANELIASVDADGEICLFTSTATDLIVDIVGYVPAGSSFNAIGPARFLDTRTAGETVDGVSQRDGKRVADSQFELQVAGRPGVPDGVSAVVVNVTAVAPEATGFVTVHPCEAIRPNASSLNYVAGVDGANELIARLDADGKICLYTDQATHLIVDVVAYLD
jgi:hypothetical protein